MHSLIDCCTFSTELDNIILCECRAISLCITLL
jgi:hypothetical protein